MYLVIRKISDNQIPLRIYEKLDNAYEYQERYIQDSSKGWNWYRVASHKEKLRKRYYRYSKYNNKRFFIERCFK